MHEPRFGEFDGTPLNGASEVLVAKSWQQHDFQMQYAYQLRFDTVKNGTENFAEKNALVEAVRVSCTKPRFTESWWQ